MVLADIRPFRPTARFEFSLLVERVNVADAQASYQTSCSFIRAPAVKRETPDRFASRLQQV